MKTETEETTDAEGQTLLEACHRLHKQLGCGIMILSTRVLASHDGGHDIEARSTGRGVTNAEHEAAIHMLADDLLGRMTEKPCACSACSQRLARIATVVELLGAKRSRSLEVH